MQSRQSFLPYKTALKNGWHENRLKMNDGKTEFIMFGAKKQLAKCKTMSIDVNKTVVNNSEVVKYLGTWMDCNLTFKDPYCQKMQDSND